MIQKASTRTLSGSRVRDSASEEYTVFAVENGERESREVVASRVRAVKVVEQFADSSYFFPEKLGPTVGHGKPFRCTNMR